MGFEVYVAGPLEYPHEREQMDDLIYALHNEYGIRNRHDVKLIVDVPRDTENGCGKQIDGVLLKDDELIILELKAYSDQVQVRFDSELEKRKREGELSLPVYYNAQPKWKVDSEIIPQDQNPIDQAMGQRTHFFILFENQIKEVKDLNLKRKIKNWIVVRCKGISYEIEEVKDYIRRDKRWLKIMQQKDVIKELNFLGIKREPYRKIIPEMFEKLLVILNAEKRIYNRWLSSRILSEHYEVSRVPFLDYIIESKDKDNVQTAIKSIERYRLRAYTEDLENLFYYFNDPQIKDAALGVLINWEYQDLEDILIVALEESRHSLIYTRALRYLSLENNYPATLRKLESILKESYELHIYWETLSAVEAINQSGTQEAGGILRKFLIDNFGKDPCRSILNEMEKDPDIIESWFDGKSTSRKKIDLLSEVIKGLGQCGNHKSLDYLLTLFRDFPYNIYRKNEETLYGSHTVRQDIKYAMIQSSYLGNIFSAILEAISNLWDGRSLDPILNKFSIIHNGIIQDEEDRYLIPLYIEILHCFKKIGVSSLVTFLAGKLDNIPYPEIGEYDRFWKLRSELIDSISIIGGEEACDIFIKVLRRYKEVYQQIEREQKGHIYQDIITEIITHLGNLECQKAEDELIPFLDKNSSDLIITGAAIRALGKIKAKGSFDRLMDMFINHEYGDYRTLEDSLISIDPKACENRILERYKDIGKLPLNSWEVSLLEKVATEDSIDLMFELIEDPDWYNCLLPKRIIEFKDNEKVIQRLKVMLGSDAPHKRSFAIEMLTLSNHWGSRTDKELEKYEDDESPLVREMVLDLYAYKQNLVKTLGYLDDPNSNIRIRCYQNLHMFCHNEICNSVIVSPQEWIDIHNVIITDGIIAFCKHYWLYDSEDEEIVDDDLSTFYFRLDDIREIRHVRVIVELNRIPRLIELIYLKIEQDDVDMELLVIPEWEEQIRRNGDIWGKYKLFADKLKEESHHLRETIKEIKKIEELLKEVLSAGFLGSKINNDLKIKFRH